MSADPYATYASTATSTPQQVAVSVAPDHYPAGLQNTVAPSSYHPQQYVQPEVPHRPSKAAAMGMDSTATQQASMGGKQRSAPIFLYVLLILLLIGVVVVIIVMTAFTASSYHQLSDIRSNTQAALATTGNSSNPTCVCPTCPNFDPQLLANALGNAFAQNADSAVTRTLDGPAFDNIKPGYDPVFDFNIARSTDQVTPYGYAKAMNVDNFPAAHNQAMAQTLFQLEVGGSNSPHHHPDGVEILFVFQGMIEVTRIEPNGGGKFVNVLHANMTVIFPRGHIHFQRNIGTTVARYISTLNSERPGVMSEAQRICDLPRDALLSMFSLKTAQNVYEMCESVPHNIIQYVTGAYPQPSSSSSSSGAAAAPQTSSSSSHA